VNTNVKLQFFRQSDKPDDAFSNEKILIVSVLGGQGCYRRRRSCL